MGREGEVIEWLKVKEVMRIRNSRGSGCAAMAADGAEAANGASAFRKLRGKLRGRLRAPPLWFVGSVAAFTYMLSRLLFGKPLRFATQAPTPAPDPTKRDETSQVS